MIEFLLSSWFYKNMMLVGLATIMLALRYLQGQKAQCNYCPNLPTFKLSTPTGPIFYCEGCKEIHKSTIAWMTSEQGKSSLLDMTAEEDEEHEEHKEDDKAEGSKQFQQLLKKIKDLFLSK
jgi:hypothetical protein